MDRRGARDRSGVDPLRWRNTRLKLVFEDTNWQCNVQGTTPPYFELRGPRLASGAPFTQTDVDAGAKVVVLGPTTADRLFGAADPVGQMIRIQKVPFTVAGVLAPVGRRR